MKSYQWRTHTQNCYKSIKNSGMEETRPNKNYDQYIYRWWSAIIVNCSFLMWHQKIKGIIRKTIIKLQSFHTEHNIKYSYCIRRWNGRYKIFITALPFYRFPSHFLYLSLPSFIDARSRSYFIELHTFKWNPFTTTTTTIYCIYLLYKCV